MTNIRRIQHMRERLDTIMTDYSNQDIINKIKDIDYDLDTLITLISNTEDRTTTVTYADGTQVTYSPDTEPIIF